MPQLYRGFAMSGNYSLRLKNRCVYAMPELAEGLNVNELSMTFQLRQAKAVYRLQVGVVEENGAFTAVKTINNATTDMEDVTVSFSGYTGTGVRTNIKRCSDSINGQLLDYLKTHDGPIGIIPMDFPSQELIDAIVKLNR